MGHGFQMRKAQERAAPLDRVQRAKDPPQSFPGRGGFLQAHQVCIELVQVLVTLDQEFLGGFLQFQHAPHPSLSRTPRTTSGWKLLSQMAATPSCRTASSLAGSVSVVTTMIGTDGTGLRWRMKSMSPRPSR